MGGRIEVGAEMSRGLEVPLAWCTVVVRLGLPVMLVEPDRILEELAALRTVVVAGLVVVLEIASVVKVLVAVLAVIVRTALHIVLFQRLPRSEIFVAVVADVMIGRVLLVLTDGRAAVKVAVASIAIFCHYSWMASARAIADGRVVESRRRFVSGRWMSSL